MPFYVTVVVLVLLLAFDAFNNFAVRDESAPVTAVITVIQLAVFVGLGFCAWKAAQGVGWCRSVLLIFGGVAVFVGLTELVTELMDGRTPLVGVAYPLAGVAILVVWLLPATSRAIRERSGQR